MTITNEIETVPCNLCGADEPSVVYQLPLSDFYPGRYQTQEWSIVSCNQCGLVYTNPRLTQEKLYEFYQFGDQDDLQYVEDHFIESADLQHRTWHQYLRVLQKHKPAQTTSGGPHQLLDIGCGAGSFLAEAQSLGYVVEGQEISPYFIDYCRSHHHFTIHEGFLDDLSLEPASYDCITAFDVLEHHPDPTALFTQIHRLLKPGGVMMMSTPDIGNWSARRYGAKWLHIHPIGHIYYFDRQTISMLFQKTKFTCVQVGGIHTIGASAWDTAQNYVTQFIRVVLLRSALIGVYKPVTARIPALTRWQVTLGNATLNHEKLLMRIGHQVVMDDTMVFVAQKR
ncbi:MAG: class I SAM-dependent methyltransferase [Chloroflexota bacterium]